MVPATFANIYFVGIESSTFYRGARPGVLTAFPPQRRCHRLVGSQRQLKHNLSSEAVRQTA